MQTNVTLILIYVKKLGVYAYIYIKPIRNCYINVFYYVSAQKIFKGLGLVVLQDFN